MKKGISISELAAQIEQTEQRKRDFIASTDKLWATSVRDPNVPNDPGEIELTVDGRETYTINRVAHEQLSDRLGIPRKYYNRMLQDQPDLLTTNLNCWLKREPEKRMIRTVGPTMRAFLSDRYRPMDNAMVANAAFPVLADYGRGDNLEVKSCEITDRRMYLQVVFPKVQGEVKQGDIVQAGLILSNSEVGFGRLLVEMLVYRLQCLNGMVRGESMSKYHVGKRIDSTDEVTYDFYSDEAIKADNDALMLKVRDTVKHSFDEAAFYREVSRLQKAAGIEIPSIKVEDTVKDITKRFNLTDQEGESVLSNLIKGGDLSKWGLANAVTRLAHNAEDYDRSVEFERIGGRIIDLDTTQWHVNA